MQLSPIEYVGRVLTILDQEGRGPLEAHGFAAGKKELPDPRAILGCMLEHQEALFESRARPEARSHVHELISVRNSWAHASPLTFDDAYRAADTLSRLFRHLGCSRKSADALKRELQAMSSQDALYEVSLEGPRPATGNFHRIAVVTCSKTKLDRAAPAIEVYTGPIFTASIDVAKSEGLPILVLSTRYGLLDPTAVIEPYDLSYEAMTPSERSDLTARLRDQLRPFIEAGLREVLVLGGSGYRTLISDALSDSPVVATPHPRWKQVIRAVYR